jgi:hypothetical protein
LHFAITGLDDGDYLGEILLFLCGIAPAAVGLLSKWAFSALGLARLQLSIAPGTLLRSA